MPQQSIPQEAFTAGEIDDLLDAREDFDDFYRSLDRALNVFVQPTGGVTRRDGLEYIDTIPTNSTFWKNNDRNDFKLINFAAREDERYITVLTHNGSDPVMKFYRDDSLVATKDGGTGSVELPYTASEISSVDWVQKLDLLILLHQDYKPREIVRDSQDTFTVNKVSFDNIPQYDFNDGSSPSEQNEKQELNFNNMSSGDNYNFSLEGEVTAEIPWTTTNSDNASKIQDILQRLPNTSDSGISVSVKDDANNKFTVEFAGNDGSFNWSNLIPAVFEGSGTIDVTETQTGESGDEDAWSATRGWPKHGTFHNSRLYFAGSKELPETFWASRIDDFFDFDQADGDEDDAIQATINSDQVSEIRWIFSGRDLLIGTGEVEYYVPVEKITPDNIRIEATTRRGSKSDISPVEVDGAVYYIQDGGKALRQFVFSFSEDSYTSKNISLLSSHLIKDPVDLSLRKSTTTDNADIIFMVNKDDGSVASLSILRGEDVIAFTEGQTKGNFRNTRSQNFENYFIVEREIPEKSPLTDSWQTLTSLPTAREGMASARDGDKIHLVGGKEGSTTVATYQRYDISDDDYDKKASLPEARYESSGDFFEGDLYVGGGVDSSSNDSKKFWKRRSDSNLWKELQDLPLKTSDHAIIEENDRLFLIAPTETHEYNPNTDTWSSLTAMTNERHNFAATSYDGSIYIFGGTDTNGDVTANTQIYDVTDDSWSQGTDMTQKRRHASAETALQESGDEIWVIGGYSGSALVSNEAYDISGDSWSSNANMTTARAKAASGIKNLKMYMIGGNNSGDQSSNERYGNLQTVHHLEKLNGNHLLDGSVRKTSGLSGTTISGFGHLQGEDVDVHADGFYKGTKTVNSSGEITLDESPTDYVEAGPDQITPTVRLLPVTLANQNETISGSKKRIYEAVLNLNETQGLTLNGSKVSFRQLGDNLLDTTIPVFNGEKRIYGLTGWSDTAQVEITQPDPQPMTVLGVIQKVSFNG